MKLLSVQPQKAAFLLKCHVNILFCFPNYFVSHKYPFFFNGEYEVETDCLLVLTVCMSFRFVLTM